MAEWLKATDCKSVLARVRWFEPTPAQTFKEGVKSKQLGNSTNKVTLDTYVHLMPESAQLGDSLLENLYEDRDTGLEESNVRRFGT